MSSAARLVHLFLQPEIRSSTRYILSPLKRPDELKRSLRSCTSWMWGQKQTSTADISRSGRIADVQIALLKVRDFSFLASSCLGLDPSSVKLTFQSRPNFLPFLSVFNKANNLLSEALWLCGRREQQLAG